MMGSKLGEMIKAIPNSENPMFKEYTQPYKQLVAGYK